MEKYEKLPYLGSLPLSSIGKYPIGIVSFKLRLDLHNTIVIMKAKKSCRELVFAGLSVKYKINVGSKNGLLLITESISIYN